MTERDESTGELPEADAVKDTAPDAGLPMPDTGATEATDKPLPPAPNFARQAAQLVIIPALIVLVAVGIALIFGKIAGPRESTANLLRKLEQTSGGGRMAGGLQDPRYKDRWLAAYEIAARIPTIDDVGERRELSDNLIRVLQHHLGPDDALLQLYLLPAIGQLGQPGGLEVILGRLDHQDTQVRQGAVRGVLSWPDRDEARAGLPGIVRLLDDREAAVRLEAAAATGAIAPEGDRASIGGLHRLMDRTELGNHEVHWNAAVALACLGDDRGADYVAEILLNREALSRLILSASGQSVGRQDQTLASGAQDRVILSTLASAERINSPVVWRRIEQLATDDSSMRIRAAATQLTSWRREQDRAGQATSDDGRAWDN